MKAQTIQSLEHLFRVHCATRHGSKLGSMAGTRKSITSFKACVDSAIAKVLTEEAAKGLRK